MVYLGRCSPERQAHRKGCLYQQRQESRYQLKTESYAAQQVHLATVGVGIEAYKDGQVILLLDDEVLGGP